MQRPAVCCLAFLVASLSGATTWKLVLKDGSIMECDGAPIIINDVYMFRSAGGQDRSLPGDQVDREKTDRANHVTPPPRQWRMIGESVHEAYGGILTLNDADFESEVLQSKTPVLVEFSAAWCGFCRKLEPTIQSLAGEYAGRLKVGKLDIDKSRATVHRYGVSGVPTLLLFDRGRVTATVHGAAGKSTIVRMLTESAAARQNRM